MKASNEENDKVGQASPEKFIRTQARELLLGECYINERWFESGKASVIVSREHANGNITCGFYLVDLLCLGLKDSFYLFDISRKEFEDVLDEMSENEDLLEVEYPLVHNVIYGSMGFAEEYQFKPHKSFQLTSFILKEDTEDIEFIEIPFGSEGKPAVVVSETNPMKDIISKLKKNAGEGNYLVFNEGDMEREDAGLNIRHMVSHNIINPDEKLMEEEDEYDDDSLLGEYDDFTEEELLDEIEEVSEEDTTEAIGPIYELFIRLPENEKFEELLEKHSQIYDEIVVVNDFDHPDLDFLPNNHLETFYDLSELVEENPEEAIARIEKLLPEFPNPVYYHLLVSAYGYVGRHEEATVLLKKALDIYSNNFMLRIGYGFILLMNDQYDSLKMFMGNFDLQKVVPERKLFHITEIARFLCLACSYFALSNQLLMATVYQKILDDFTDIPEGTYYQKLTTFNILCPLQWEYIHKQLKD
jgi:tetratricopeptide (TPR) repeat protein